MTRQNPNNAAPVASFTPPLSTPDSTHSTLNVVAVGKDSGGDDIRHSSRSGRVYSSLEMLRFDAEIRSIRSRSLKGQGIVNRCELCGCNQRSVPHHHSYFEPHSFIFLCRSHHQHLHRRLREYGRDVVDVYIRERTAGRPAPPEALPQTPEHVAARYARQAEEHSARMLAMHRRVRAMETAQPGVE